MTWNPRLDVVEELEAAGWAGDADNPLGLLRRNGAVWGVTSDGGDSSLTEPAGGETIEFPSGTPAELIVVACLAAAGQLGDLVHRTGRLRLALASAKRRAARRQPHEREGLIFHLERENERVHAYVRVAHATAEGAHRHWAEAVEEAGKLRERNGRLQARIDTLTGRLEQLENSLVTEYRVPAVPPNYTPLIVRRDLAWDGTRWAVLHDPGDRAVRRAWTPEGWRMTSVLTRDEIHCWPDGVTARTEAERLQAGKSRGSTPAP